MRTAKARSPWTSGRYFRAGAGGFTGCLEADLLPVDLGVSMVPCVINQYLQMSLLPHSRPLSPKALYRFVTNRSPKGTNFTPDTWETAPSANLRLPGPARSRLEESNRSADAVWASYGAAARIKSSAAWFSGSTTIWALGSADLMAVTTSANLFGPPLSGNMFSERSQLCSV